MLYLRNLDCYLKNCKKDATINIDEVKKPSFRLKKGEESPTKLSKYDSYFVKATLQYKNYEEVDEDDDYGGEEGEEEVDKDSLRTESLTDSSSSELFEFNKK